jgi:hypothetical protein
MLGVGAPSEKYLLGNEQNYSRNKFRKTFYYSILKAFGSDVIR